MHWLGMARTGNMRYPGFDLSSMPKEIHDTKAHTVVSFEDTFQDREFGAALSGYGSRYLSAD